MVLQTKVNFQDLRRIFCKFKVPRMIKIFFEEKNPIIILVSEHIRIKIEI